MKIVQIIGNSYSLFSSTLLGALFFGFWVTTLQPVFAQEGAGLYISVGSPCRVTKCVDVIATSIGDNSSDAILVFEGGSTVLGYTGSDMSGANNWSGTLCGLVKGVNNVYAYSEELDMYSDATTVTLTAYDATQADIDFQDPFLSPTVFGGWSAVKRTATISSIAIHYEPGDSTATVTFVVPTLSTTDPYQGSHTLTPAVHFGMSNYVPDGTVSSYGCSQSQPYWPAPPASAAFKASGWERGLRATVSSDGCDITGWSLFQPKLW